MRRVKQMGFTLAELLIALAILGVIATFTIPKVLNASASSQNTAIAKEAASMISGAFQAYALNNTIASGTTAGVFTDSMNYVSVKTTGASGGATNCGATTPCLQLHNGALMQYGTTAAFNGTSTSAALAYHVDPDGAGTGATPVTFIIFSNGRITTAQNAGSYSTTTGGITAVATDPAYIQNWN